MVIGSALQASERLEFLVWAFILAIRFLRFFLTVCRHEPFVARYSAGLLRLSGSSNCANLRHMQTISLTMRSPKRCKTSQLRQVV